VHLALIFIVAIILFVVEIIVMRKSKYIVTLTDAQPLFLEDLVHRGKSSASTI